MFTNILPVSFIIYSVFSCCDASSFGALRRSGPQHDRVVVCYYASWASFRLNRGECSVDNIDPSICTHLIYTFAGLDVASSTIRSLDPFLDLEENYGKGSYKKLTSLQKKNPHLKVSIAIGGWNEGSQNYSALAEDPEKRKTFIHSVLTFLKTHNFQGFDLDWEYPTKRGGAPQDKENFVLLAKELHEALHPNGYLLTAAVGAGKDTMEDAYDLKELNKYLDFIHLMCYDYHGKWDKMTGANTPLTSNDPNDYFTVEYSVNYMLTNGVEAGKLVLGMAMYGRTFILLDELSGKEKLGGPTGDMAFSGPYSKEEGFMGYNEICIEMMQNDSWVEHWDDATQTPFAVNGKKIITFDNKRSLQEKVKFAMQKDLAGVMVWSLDTDDFLGDCTPEQAEKETFPLIKSLSSSIISSLQEIEIEKEKEAANAKTELPNNDISPSSSTQLIFSFILPFLFLFVHITL